MLAGVFSVSSSLLPINVLQHRFPLGVPCAPANIIFWNDAVILRNRLPLHVELNFEYRCQPHGAIADVKAGRVAAIGDLPSPALDDAADVIAMRLLDVHAQMRLRSQ